jgi:hypothetical protein
MVVVVLERVIVRHRIMAVELVRREMVEGHGHLGMETAELGRLGMETVELDRREMETVEEHVLRATAEALVLLEMGGELLRVGHDHQVTVEGPGLRVMVAGLDRPGTEERPGRRLRLVQRHLRLALLPVRGQHRRLVLHRRLVRLRLDRRRGGLTLGIRREERSRRNGLSRRLVRDRADLVAITMAQRHGRRVIAAKPVLAATEHVREANLDEALQA